MDCLYLTGVPWVSKSFFFTTDPNSYSVWSSSSVHSFFVRIRPDPDVFPNVLHIVVSSTLYLKRTP